MPDTSDQKQLYPTDARITPEPPRHYVSINEVQRMVRGHRIAGFFWALGFIGLAHVLVDLFAKNVPISYEWLVLSLGILVAAIYEGVFLYQRRKHLEERSISLEEYFDKTLESYSTSTPGRQLSRSIGFVSVVEYRRKRGSDTWHWCKNCSNWPTIDYDVKYTKPASGEFDNECRAKENADNCRQ